MKELEQFPRLSLGVLPTPLYKLENLSRQLGKNLYIKRDDMIGVALGGNKVRKLEFLLADAREKGADVVLTAGGAQSNHAMLTAACAARLGMSCVLLLKQRGVTERRGNLVLDELYGAQVRFVDTDRYEDIYAEMDRLAAELARESRKVFQIPVGGSTALGALGYAGCVEEIARQLPQAAHIVSAIGSGGTTAGLLLGARLFLPGAAVTGVAVDTDPFEEIVPRLAEEAAALLGAAPDCLPGGFRMVSRVGQGYAIPNPADTPYIHELARSEGILLDPVYTGKAWAGMLELLESGGFPGGGDLVFVHTGGAAALFAMDLG